jgi:hypothetical protein
MLTLGERSQILIPDLERGPGARRQQPYAGGKCGPDLVAQSAGIGAELDVTSAYREALASASRSRGRRGG